MDGMWILHSSTTYPPARVNATMWVVDNDVWIYGGSEYNYNTQSVVSSMSDMWRYQNNEWAIIKPNLAYRIPTYAKGLHCMDMLMFNLLILLYKKRPRNI